MADVIRGVAESSRAFLASQGHQPIVTLPPESVQIEGDVVRLTQILMNLINNAAKYTPKGENIWVSANVEGDHAIISVKDGGIGIASDKLRNVFEKFYQIDASLERSESGLGLGLTLTRRLVELHGGTVEARSDGLGKGSEFIVSLPILLPHEQAQETEQSIEAKASDAHWRILIVDDGARTREMYSILLRKRGHEVETAPDGKTGVEMVQRFRPDVILLDVGMPRLNGFDTCLRIRELPGGKDIVTIAVTGWAQEEVQKRADESGFDGILVKPVGVQQIVELAGSLLERKQKIDEVPSGDIGKDPAPGQRV